VEWIGNAKPEDEAAIRAEIKKKYYDVGDTIGGDALNRALSDALEAGNNKKARQEIVDNFADFAKTDPAEIGFLREIIALPGMLAGPRAGTRAAEEGAAAEAETGAAGAEAAAENPWKMGWAKRGDYFSEKLGANLPRTFKTIDRWENGIATSIKSIDLSAATYQDAARLTHRLNDYIGKVASYIGGQMGYIKIESGEIVGRELSIAIPKGTMTAVQREAIEAARTRARSFGVELKITEF
jgi:contact-dependent growth inhibition (CDI) system restriction endonuclease-like protein